MCLTKASVPPLQDTLAGHVMSMMSNAASAKPHVDAGTLRALAVTSRKRIPALPDVPSVAETGVKDYEVLNWFGRVRAGWHAAADRRPAARRGRRDLAIPETKARLAGEGAEPVASKPADFAAFVRDEIKKWDEVGKAANIQPTE